MVRTLLVFFGTRMMKAFAALCFLLAATLGWCHHARSRGNALLINGVEVVRLRAASNGVTPDQRAKRAADALAMVGAKPEIVTKRIGESEAAVYVSGAAVVTLRADDQETTGDVATFAQKVGDKMRSAYALPPLKVSEDRIKLGPGWTRDINIVGTEAHQVDLLVGDTNVVQLEPTSYGAQLRALAPGRSTITVQSPSGRETVDVLVLPPAAEFPQTLSASVAGQPANASTVRGAVESALRSQLKIGEEAKYTFAMPEVNSVMPGRSTTIPVRVRVSGKSLIESVGNVDVVVRNLEEARNISDLDLWYCNDPESIKRPVALFSSVLKPGRGARLLYHHMNAMTQPVILRVQVVNESEHVTKILILPGDSKPDVNPVRAGMVAAIQYLSSFILSSGEIVTIPPHTSMPISLRRMMPQETVSGLCSLRMIEGPDELTVRADAFAAVPLEGKWWDASRSSTPWREVGANPVTDADRSPVMRSDHIYPNPLKNERLTYQVGGRFGILRLGNHPIASAASENNLDGNYGVIYKIEAVIDNPTNNATTVELAFESSSGYSAGLFYVEGKLIQTPYLGPKEETTMMRISVPANTIRTISLTTLPISGGCYPATLFLRPQADRGDGTRPPTIIRL